MANTQESAVSPVVGVMLMLVVVIIIAAVVSGFAGSLVGTNTKPPQATIQGKYSYSADIFQIYHAGGDELSTQKLIVKIQQNDEDFGGYGSLFSSMGTQGLGIIIANKSFICNPGGSGCWITPSTGATGLAVFRPGDTVLYNQSFRAGFSGYTDPATKKTDVVGRSLILEFDTIDGKLVSKSKVMIDP
jgi:archaeal type IV pilus assembly protein PilA